MLKAKLPTQVTSLTQEPRALELQVQTADHEEPPKRQLERVRFAFGFSINAVGLRGSVVQGSWNVDSS